MTALTSILILFAAFLAVYCEAAFQGIRHLLGTQVHLLPSLMVFAALSTGLTTITATAILGGLLFDSLSANPLGVSILPLFIVGIAIYTQRELILRDQVFAQWILGLAASVLVPAVTVLLILSQGHSPLLSWGSLWQWIVLGIGGATATPIWFLLFGILDRTLNYQRATETTFRPDREIRRGRR